MKQKKSVSAWFMVVIVVFAFGVLPIAYAGDETFACVSDADLDKDIAAGAELAGLECFFKKWEGQETLHFKVSVKNTGDKPQRFKINIFLDNGKAVGGLIPRTTKNGLVEPGATDSFIYPVGGMTEKPGKVTLIIKVIE